MSERSVLAVPGIERLSPGALVSFWEMCERNGWDPDALAAVISSESGFQSEAGAYAWTPKRTASGLIQFIEDTAKGLGVAPTRDRPPNVRAGQGGDRAWSTWQVLWLGAEAQMPLVEAYYRRAFRDRAPMRRVDYYLPAWGAWHGLPMERVLATAGTAIYDGNRGLDTNKDGQITVSDLDARLESVQAQAKGRRVEVPVAREPGKTSGAILATLGLGMLVWWASRKART